jgi:uncharacterized DUF497 family protein
MYFEWDTAKSDATFQARGFDFAYASRIFAAAWIASEDTRTDYGETRIDRPGWTRYSRGDLHGARR